MRPEDIRKAVKPYVPGWQSYPEWWNGSFGLFQAYTSVGVRISVNPQVVNTTVGGGQALYIAAASASDGNYYEVTIPLRAGTYSFSMNYTKSNTYGKFDLYVGSTKVNGTILDCYAASATYNNQWDVDSIVIPSDGWYTFKIVTNGKNASSSDYQFGGGICIIRRTG